MPTLNNDLDSQRALQRLYDASAAMYDQAMGAVFEPLAADLAAWTAQCVSAYREGALHDPFSLGPQGPSLKGDPPLRILDVGAGTGLLAAHLARALPGAVIGLDVSSAMLRQAASRESQALRFAQGHLHRLPFRRGQFDLIAASFGLNASDPARALRSLARVLRPGGLLVMQEWGALDPALAALEAAFTACHDGLEGPIAELAAAALDHYRVDDNRWYAQIQDADDVYRLLKRTGFRLAWAQEAVFIEVRFNGPESLLNSRLGWASRGAWLAAVPEPARAACLEAARAALTAFQQGDGALRWRPALLRACAVRD